MISPSPKNINTRVFIVGDEDRSGDGGKAKPWIVHPAMRNFDCSI